MRHEKRITAMLAAILLLDCGAVAAQAKIAEEESPSASLAAMLVAACRQNETQFARYQTEDNAAAFSALPEKQRVEMMKRFVQLADGGRPLLSTDAAGRTVVRCETSSVTAEIKLSAARVRENLAFVPVEITGGRQAEFGMVREGGRWRLLSLGLLLINIPELAKQWSAARVEPQSEDVSRNESAAVAALRDLAGALKTYQEAYGHLPERLAQLGPARRGEISPDRANLVDAELAAGKRGGYAFTYVIVPAESKSGDKQAPAEAAPPAAPGYALSATPLEYGRGGRMSFFLDGTGVLRGADKQGAPATSADPSIESR